MEICHDEGDKDRIVKRADDHTKERILEIARLEKAMAQVFEEDYL